MAQNKTDKAKQFVGLIGGFLGALYLALTASGIELLWFNPDTINTWMAVLNAGIPLAFIAYGIYKNQYLLSEKARKQEEELKRKGLK